MKGLQYIVDSKGKRKAVLLDLDIYADKWEDIYDILVSYSRRNEKRVKWETLKKHYKNYKENKNIFNQE
ncbi:MAG: hypothetical protein WC879_17945 [Melioribacteraceae bacterium]